MQLHELRARHRPKKKKRVGRGGKKGTYSGRGIKGQKSRAGRRLQPAIRQIIKRYPKLRGYSFKSAPKAISSVNLDILEKKFKENEVVSPKTLLEKNIIRKIKGRIPAVKILGTGKLSKPLIVQDCALSKGAREKIEKAKNI